MQVLYFGASVIGTLQADFRTAGSGGGMTPCPVFLLPGARETPILAVLSEIITGPAASPRRFLKPNALRIAIACSGVGSSSKRRHPSVSPSCVIVQNRNRLLMADHLRGE